MPLRVDLGPWGNPPKVGRGSHRVGPTRPSPTSQPLPQSGAQDRVPDVSAGQFKGLGQPSEVNVRRKRHLLRDQRAPRFPPQLHVVCGELDVHQEPLPERRVSVFREIRREDSVSSFIFPLTMNQISNIFLWVPGERGRCAERRDRRVEGTGGRARQRTGPGVTT